MSSDHSEEKKDYHETLIKIEALKKEIATLEEFVFNRKVTIEKLNNPEKSRDEEFDNIGINQGGMYLMDFMANNSQKIVSVVEEEKNYFEKMLKQKENQLRELIIIE